MEYNYILSVFRNLITISQAPELLKTGRGNMKYRVEVEVEI